MNESSSTPFDSLSTIYTLQKFARKFVQRRRLQRQAFFAACEFGLKRNLQLALLRKIDVNLINEEDPYQLKRTGLHYACGGGHDEVVGMLLDNGAIQKEDAKHMFPIHYCCQNTSAYLQSLNSATSQWKADYTTTSEMPWTEDCLVLLLQQNPSINSQNDAGQSPLHLACAAGLTGITRILCEYKAEVNLLDRMCRAPVHLCAWGGHTKCVEMLLLSKANPNVANVIGRTPLHVAAVYGHTSVCEKLLEFGAAIDAVNNNINTPLHVALLDGFKETAEFLIDAGAETSLANRNGDTVLGICVEKYTDLALKILNKRRVESSGGSLYGDKITATYTYTGIDDRHSLAADSIVEDKTGVMLHPHSKTVSEIIGATKQIPILERKGSTRSAAAICNQETPLFRMVSSNNRDLVCHPVVLRLLELKWKKFAKRKLILEAIMHLFLTVTWMASTVGWGAATEVSIDEKYDISVGGNSDRIYEAILLWVCLATCAYILFREIFGLFRRGWRNIRREYRAKDYWWFFDVITMTFLLSFVSVSHVMAFYYEGHTNKLFQRFSMATGSLLIWARFLQFFAAFRTTGPLVKIITKMAGDMVNFALIYSVILFGFAHAFFMVLALSYDEDNAESGGAAGFSSFSSSILSTFRSMIRDFGFSNFVGTSSVEMATTLYVAYTISATILMLNLIVAMLNETYSTIKYDSTREWRLQWAARILKIESSSENGAKITGVETVNESPVVATKETRHEKIFTQISDFSKSVEEISMRITKEENFNSSIHQKLDMLLSRAPFQHVNPSRSSSRSGQYPPSPNRMNQTVMRSIQSKFSPSVASPTQTRDAAEWASGVGFNGRISLYIPESGNDGDSLSTEPFAASPSDKMLEGLLSIRSVTAQPPIPTRPTHHPRPTLNFDPIAEIDPVSPQTAAPTPSPEFQRLSSTMNSPLTASVLEFLQESSPKYRIPTPTDPNMPQFPPRESPISKSPASLVRMELDMSVDDFMGLSLVEKKTVAKKPPRPPSHKDLI